MPHEKQERREGEDGVLSPISKCGWSSSFREEQHAQRGMAFLILKMIAGGNPNPMKGQAPWPGWT